MKSEPPRRPHDAVLATLVLGARRDDEGGPRYKPEAPDEDAVALPAPEPRAATQQDAEPESGGRFREVLDGLPDAVLVRQHGRYVYANKTALDMFGFSRVAELTELGVEDVGSQPSLERAPKEAPARVVAVRQAERRARCSDGTFLVVEVSVMHVQVDGEPAQVIVARDAAARHELATKIARMDRIIALGTLAAGVGHEINNPLAYIMGNLELAADEVVSVTELVRGLSPTSAVHALVERFDELGVVLREAREGAERVRCIVNELRSLSSAGRGDREAIPLPRILDSAASIVSNELRHRARLVKDYGPAPEVLANESRLVQVFVHLLVNAAHAIPEGDTGSHEVRIRTSTDEVGRAVVLVEDTGSGIPETLLGRVFDPFFTTKAVGSGTGLGLSICQHIVQPLGGDIAVESEVGRGTTVRVALPAAPKRELPAPKPSGEPTAGRARVLVVDDDPFIGRTVIRSLAREHDVVATVRGQDLLERLEQGERFDVILCDLMMPDMSGMDLFEAVSKRFPDQTPKMVFMTGGAFTPRAQGFLDTDVPRLEKPFSMDAVRETIRRILR